MQPTHDPQLDQMPEDEAEAFIGQEGAEGFDGEVIDDLDGEGARAMPGRRLDSAAAAAAAAAAVAGARMERQQSLNNHP
jgi:hypothetical protein